MKVDKEGNITKLLNQKWVEEIRNHFVKVDYPEYEDYIPLAGDTEETSCLVKMAFQMGVDACKAFIDKQRKALKSKMEEK